MRLIKRISTLRMILNAIAACVWPLLGAITILFLVIAAFAIIATDAWGDQDENLARFSSSLFTVRRQLDVACIMNLYPNDQIAAWKAALEIIKWQACESTIL